MPVIVVVALLAACGGGGQAHISVDHPVALWDEPLRITVTGLKSDERTVLRATSRDARGKRYASSTPVTASSEGHVQLEGDAALRPLWSLRPVGLSKGTDFFYDTPPSGATVNLAIAGARTTLRRRIVAPGIHGVPISHPFYGKYYAPATTSTPRLGILVFGGSEGGLSTTGLAALYASHGYPSLALAYFGEPSLPRNLLRIPLEYFASALRWLQQQPSVAPSKLAVEGISRGSEAAQLLGIHYPHLVHAVIAMVPANGSACGITRVTAANPTAHCIGAAWTFHGKAIPYALAATQYTPYPFPDEQIDGSIFLDCAGLDQVWPSCPMAQAIVSRLQAHHFHHKITFLEYPNASHALGTLYPNLIYYSTQLGGSNTNSNNEAAANGWPKLLHFLHAVDS
ncbi:MAG TPA: acyl-CoA thioester hydrolase/BAAT C-terminal domain-containing protein [Gaiellaceae bacterium]|nr:acyl-CoA thioester hydrolase/BAAT C-terminal domain-containing protein [Gaiellaceae bacterium]